MLYLEFSWVPASPLFSVVEFYQPVTVAGLVYLEFMWGTAHPPHCSGAYSTSVPVASLAHPKLARGSCQTHLLWRACLFTVHVGNCPSPTLLWSIPHVSHCCKPCPPQACWGELLNPPSLAGFFLQFMWVPALPPFSRAQGAHPLC
jgi:hypothetical protein